MFTSVSVKVVDICLHFGFGYNQSHIQQARVERLFYWKRPQNIDKQTKLKVKASPKSRVCLTYWQSMVCSGSQPMMAKPMKTLQWHYPMLQFLIVWIILTISIITSSIITIAIGSRPWWLFLVLWILCQEKNMKCLLTTAINFGVTIIWVHQLELSSVRVFEQLSMDRFLHGAVFISCVSVFPTRYLPIFLVPVCVNAMVALWSTTAE